MASFTTLHLISMTLLISLLVNAAFTTGLEEDEFQSMVNVLRDNSGYNLFGNAITTSELFYEILSGKTFTIFAPTDSSLFALDMTNSAADYTAYLRCHVIPAVRISFSELRSLPAGSSFPTLLKDNRIPFLFQRRTPTPTPSASDEEFISVGGVRVTSPGLFYSRNLAVHGLAGTINCRSHQESPWMDDNHRTPPLPPPLNSPPNRLPVIHRHPPPPPPPPPVSPRANSSGEDTPLRSSVPPRSQSQHEHSSGSQIFSSPIFSQRQSPSPSPISGGYSESPINLTPQISPDSYDVWSPPPEIGASSDSNYVPPPIEFSENDDPIAFPPSDFGNFENQDPNKQYAESELGSLSSNGDDDLLISPEDYVPIISQDEKSAEETEDYSDEINRDCPRTDGFTQISSFFPGTTNMFCAKTPLLQPQNPSVVGVIQG